MMNRNEMVEQLKNGICEVVFEKVNGDERTMSATLSPNHLPERDDEAPSSIQRSDDVVAVWDMLKEDWRSFRVNSVKQFEQLTGDAVKAD
tara:strand:- start:104 stop:373 length:270 start_codon:yes stop_codon:yes gene_type:complete